MNIKISTIAVIIVFVFFPILFSFAIQKTQPSPGQKLFESKCAKCHGTDGTKEKAGAKKLSVSKTTDAEIMAMIETGKKAMPSFKNKFSSEEIKELTDYVKSLRK